MYNKKNIPDKCILIITILAITQVDLKLNVQITKFPEPTTSLANAKKPTIHLNT